MSSSVMGRMLARPGCRHYRPISLSRARRAPSQSGQALKDMSVRHTVLGFDWQPLSLTSFDVPPSVSM